MFSQPGIMALQTGFLCVQWVAKPDQVHAILWLCVSNPAISCKSALLKGIPRAFTLIHAKLARYCRAMQQSQIKPSPPTLVKGPDLFIYGLIISAGLHHVYEMYAKTFGQQGELLSRKGFHPLNKTLPVHPVTTSQDYCQETGGQSQ